MPPRPKRKAVDNTAKAAKRARGETDLTDGLCWDETGPVVRGVRPLLHLTSPTLEGREKVAGFDIDWTVIKTKSGRKFATGAKDWDFLYPSVPEKLRELNKDGYRVLFFTNQAGIEKMKVNANELRTKIEDIISTLGIPVQAFVSSAVSQYRKPSTCMWDHFVNHNNQGMAVSVDDSLYVGDAAGRAKNWAPEKPRDFSCSDRQFAANIGCKFYTPEAFFLGEKEATFKWGSLDPVQFLKTAPKPNAAKTYHSKTQELVLLVGPPASGKSTFTKRYLIPHGYAHVNRDTLGTPAKCMKAAEEALKKGQSVAVDNTNPAAHTRADYIKLANKKGVPCRCFVMTTTHELAQHLNEMRMVQTDGDVRRVPDVGYNVYFKNFTEPSTDEGFSEVVKIDFAPDFRSKKDEALFKEWTPAGGR